MGVTFLQTNPQYAGQLMNYYYYYNENLNVQVNDDLMCLELMKLTDMLGLDSCIVFTGDVIEISDNTHIINSYHIVNFSEFDLDINGEVRFLTVNNYSMLGQITSSTFCPEYDVEIQGDDGWYYICDTTDVGLMVEYKWQIGW